MRPSPSAEADAARGRAAGAEAEAVAEDEPPTTAAAEADDRSEVERTVAFQPLEVEEPTGPRPRRVAGAPRTMTTRR